MNFCLLVIVCGDYRYEEKEQQRLAVLVENFANAMIDVSARSLHLVHRSSKPGDTTSKASTAKAMIQEDSKFMAWGD